MMQQLLTSNQLSNYLTSYPFTKLLRAKQPQIYTQNSMYFMHPKVLLCMTFTTACH